MLDVLVNAFALIGAVVSGATLIVAGLEKIAEVTPTTKDDKAVATVKRVLSQVSALLDNINVYTTKDKKV
jgi:multidrug resistance efflux pump